VVFAVTIKEIKEHELPPIDDELAKLSGAGQTLEELRERVEERLRAAAQRDAIFAQQKAAVDQLIETSSFEVPEVIVDDEVDRDIRNLAISLGQQGIDFEKFIEFGGADLNQLREERRPAARDRAAQELVLDALAEQQGIEPSPAHVDAEADRVLAGSDDADRLKSSDRVRAYVAERMRLQWALLWLSATARGEEWVPPEPGADDGGDGALAASEEVMAAEPESSGAAVVDAPERADGMTEI
jgi:trigger factor